ncbi:MAG: aminomethyl-transferring glycine dehydrogenase [Segniliparus sp.]|uniref:aminomethyl-transferring glycine dehydrogenase n=1 Tax=Segniliparus sp. TaxID=2804064 RepID=UPI003F2CEFB9
MSAATERVFADRHIGPNEAELAKMLTELGVESLEALAGKAVPGSILDAAPGYGLDPAAAFKFPWGQAEHEVLEQLTKLASENTVAVSMIGLGYYDTVTPPVLRRSLVENPAWYTAYTPYQPEISQGRLEALLNFQTMVSDLSGQEIANASMLDEATAAAEAMTLLRRASKSKSDRLVVDADLYPQTRAVLETRAEPLGIELVEADLGAGEEGLPPGDFFGVILQQFGASGKQLPVQEVVAAAHGREALVAVGTDLLAATLVTPPGELGAEACYGSAQRFGVPLGYGGPHAGFLATKQAHARQLPGRLVGVSVDADGHPAYRLALQTREQHIRREKATSNICTAQVLLAVLAAMYASYHGPDGLRAIARRTHERAEAIASGLGGALVHERFFDTVLAQVPGRASSVVAVAKLSGINLRLVDRDHVSVSCDETTTEAHVAAVLAAFGAARTQPRPVEIADRASPYLTHPSFNRYHSETAMLRYLRELSDKDIALDRSMIPLGSCTMKLNAAAEMEPISYAGFARIHPFAPDSDTVGYRKMIKGLEAELAFITGYHSVSLQPNAGSQGELAGLLAIRAYHHSRDEAHRDVCLIPSSAHGTNAASAVMAGMRVVVVACRENGDVDLDDLKAKLEAHGEKLAAIMITYPSTHGVYEVEVKELCGLVHDAGGQVYIDGANLNALVGLARPGHFGGDVSHLNLHKTFCIPHGGGGPGVGPVAVGEHLAPFLPGHPLRGGLGDSGPVSAAPFGSASILPISWAYIQLMGFEGLRRATLTAIASANYLARKLDQHFPVLFTGANGLVAHECILDLRQITKETGVTAEDVAKRLADYGFHAPTLSFPVSGTLMVEPTESESLEELDAFVAAMVAIKGEIDQVAGGVWSAEESPLRGAPHTARAVTSDSWERKYSREVAAYPKVASAYPRPKVWPGAARIDGVAGDRNLVCSCPPIEAYAE